MRNLIKIIKAKRAESRELHAKLENLTDRHFFTVAEFVRNYELNTNTHVTGKAVTELRALLG